MSPPLVVGPALVSAHGTEHGTTVGPALLVPLLAGWLYLAAALRQRAPDRAGWSHWRTAAFAGGCALLAIALLVPTDDFAGHMWQHLLLGMLAPLGLVLGAPGILALRCLDRRAGRAALRVLGRPALRPLTHPVTGLLLTAGGVWLLYLTPLYRATLDSAALHDLVNLHFLLSGLLFTWSIAGPEPYPHRARVPVRLVVLGAAVVAHASLAQLMYAGMLVDVPATTEHLRAGATVMYYGGDLAEILLALALLTTWRPGPHRQTVGTAVTVGS
ncbi:cytochrome c oxidase assembly protein [Verrucosispora sp. WMMA2044]|uniref:cytochrome c oxidase assembly protein n=1 Tax=Verrucosispora sp. WMMA2044 TaxID=3016419 RepID=UPI00248D161E|nr:cytochrome c oxidase assembly protein [Verrucosispora sp. WMMA2044]WBB46488.1 cytochrome c oxidase assembly protein [Verrucosispora sp. WMMA2044]